jgi:hypothetical protein
MVVVKDHQQREPSMGNITTIGKKRLPGSCSRCGGQRGKLPLQFVALRLSARLVWLHRATVVAIFGEKA